MGMHEQEQESPLPRELPDMFREAIARLQAAEQELDRQFEAEQRENERARDHLAERARKGELGPDWQRVQQRIDLDETSLEAVFSGTDESPAARALRERSQKNLQELAAEWRQEDEDGDGEQPSPAAVVSQASADSAEHFAQAAQRISEALSAIRGVALDRDRGM